MQRSDFEHGYDRYLQLATIARKLRRHGEKQLSKPYEIGAAEFKACCLELTDRVREVRGDLIITFLIPDS
jgi:hypothetical protein